MNIVFMHGEKGGVGKSMATKAAVEFFRGRGRNPHTIEADAANGHTSRTYGAEAVDLREAEGWERLTVLAAQEPDRDIVVDLPADIGSMFDAYLPRLQDDLAFGGIRPNIICMFVMAPNETSIAQLRAAMESDKSQAETLGRESWIEWCAVKNMGKLAKADIATQKPHLAVAEWQGWTESKTRAMLLQNNGFEIELPILAPSAVALLEDGNVGPAQILGGAYTLVERSAVHRWLTASAKQFAVVFE